MATVFEALRDNQELPIHEAVAAGADILSGEKEFVFIPYIRRVLPLDGFVFWVRASLLSPGIAATVGLPSTDPITIQGSLHYSSQGTQIEDESIVIRRVELTTSTPVPQFTTISPNVLFVGEYLIEDIGSFKFAFSQRGAFYQQASIFHYVGDALYAAFEQQLIDDISQFDERPVVSNSLPIWLSMVQDNIPFPAEIPMPPSIVLYPSFLVPVNLPPPYAVVHIAGNNTRALQSVPWRDKDGSHWQLASDNVEFTFYGYRNDEVLDFQDYIYDVSLNTDAFGLMSAAAIVNDDKRPQVELHALAQKKTLRLEVSYYQKRMREVARQMLKNITLTLEISDFPV